MTWLMSIGRETCDEVVCVTGDTYLWLIRFTSRPVDTINKMPHFLVLYGFGKCRNFAVENSESLREDDYSRKYLAIKE